MKNYNKVTTLLAIVFVFTISVELNAQSRSGGIKGGLNLSSLTIEEADDNNIIPGFHAGLWMKNMFTEQFGVQPEILFSTKGVKTVYNEEFLGFDVADGNTKLNLNYIDVPIYFVFQLAEDFDFHLGPRIGYLLNASMETQAEVLEFIDVDDEDEIDRENFNTLDYGFSGGLGFYLDPVTIGFNYDMGLRPVAKDGEFTEDLLGDARNSTIQIYLGFAF
ncbi:MAG: porin family protein [Bacteroidota bacterium]